MAETTISWTHTRTPDGRPVPGYTFNPWIGCQKISPACDGCYAENLMATRYQRVEWGAPGKGIGTRSRTSKGYWHQPLRWNKLAAEQGTRPFVFCASLADVFDNHVPASWRTDLFDLIAATPNLVWLLLTKRPQMIIELCHDARGLPPNAALGTTAEDQARWEQNIGPLAQAKAATGALFSFASCEPLLGPIYPWRAKVTKAMMRDFAWGASAHEWFDPLHPRLDRRFRLDWIITGGETSQGMHKARPSHPSWFRTMRDVCALTGTAYHHKQNGEWAVASEENGHFDHSMSSNGAVWVHVDGKVTSPSWMRSDIPNDQAREPIAMFRAGRAAAGRLLDGIEHNQHPEICNDVAA